MIHISKKIKITLITAGIVLLLLILVIYTNTSRVSPPAPRNFPTASKPVEITDAAFQIDHGWGYKIMVNGKLYIYQNQIPAIAGYHLFASEQQALAVADLVVAKMRKGLIPRVTISELEELNVIPLDSTVSKSN
jgi:Domain of unknown function (DUF4907)